MFCSVLLTLGAARAAPGGAAADWIARECTLAGGAFSVRPGGRFVNGYFGNITAGGLAAAHQYPGLVRGWMQWYMVNAHDSVSGIEGVPDDRTLLEDGSIVSRGRPDSTDAYGATFLILANAAFASGDPDLQAFLKSRHADVLRIARSILVTQQPDGLTFSRPQHRVAYAIDNEQVYRGLLDGATLMEEAYGDRRSALWMRERAAAVARGIAVVLWDAATQTYRPAAGAAGEGEPADLSVAYPDALAQAYAVYYGVTDARSPRALSLLARAGPALQNPARGDAGEYRLVLLLAQRAAGSMPPPIAFQPPAVCADAGWYLQVFARTASK